MCIYIYRYIYNLYIIPWVIIIQYQPSSGPNPTPGRAPLPGRFFSAPSAPPPSVFFAGSDVGFIYGVFFFLKKDKWCFLRSGIPNRSWAIRFPDLSALCDAQPAAGESAAPCAAAESSCPDRILRAAGVLPFCWPGQSLPPARRILASEVKHIVSSELVPIRLLIFSLRHLPLLTGLAMQRSRRCPGCWLQACSSLARRRPGDKVRFRSCWRKCR